MSSPSGNASQVSDGLLAFGAGSRLGPRAGLFITAGLVLLVANLGNRRRSYSNASTSTDQLVPASGFTASR